MRTDLLKVSPLNHKNESVGIPGDSTRPQSTLARETGQPITDPVRLIVPMLERFITTDRGFAKARREVG
ncbi:DUF2274 domain-containing protein [Roseospira visakhapatnamensis]|uniref:DUF2274 domain-containing protein n=1 Tax=Roseospira visakhapatnamensis TaxID=390880 RepID=A0A7W6WBF0_9PROT|nr:hypothetical protein [Roseospira visakhapatnamensis]